VLVAVAACVFGCEAILLHGNASGSAFMLVAGVSSAEEMCLRENAGKIGLEACSAGVAAGDGRELWSLLGGGQLMNVVSKTCASAAVGATTVSMSDCGGASTWELLANGQARVGEKCLSLSGEGAGTENAASHAAAEATSSANSASHAAAAAVDADDATFWASKPGDAGPVALTIDLGEARSINILKIVWEFPAQAFAVSVSPDGLQWTEIFATTVNMVRVNRIPLGLTASKVRVDMKKPHPLHETAAGRPVYGIKSISVLAHRLDVALDDCAAASQAKDARDKYFPVSVSDFDPATSAALRAELPAMAAATVSLSTALADIAALPGCDGEAALLGASALLATSSMTRSNGEAEDGFDADVKQLLATARSVIVAARDVLR